MPVKWFSERPTGEVNLGTSNVRICYSRLTYTGRLRFYIWIHICQRYWYNCLEQLNEAMFITYSHIFFTIKYHVCDNNSLFNKGYLITYRSKHHIKLCTRKIIWWTSKLITINVWYAKRNVNHWKCYRTFSLKWCSKKKTISRFPIY